MFGSMFGKKGGTPQVVHARAPALRTALLIAALLVALFALYVVYELGRYNAGYDRQAVAQQRTEFEVRIEQLEKENREMRTQMAELDTFRVGRAQEQAEVARAMGELQAQVARESQELAFYRGVVAQGATSIGLKIEQLRITAGTATYTYLVHFSLMRSGRADAEAAGTLTLSLEGTAGTEAKSLDFYVLSDGRTRELRYAFRYFQDFDQEIAVPPSFKPEQLQIEVRSGRKDVAALSQSF
ncbi:MAG TPA: DUF6776 family protein, partial [Steroidobacteraceae bacterium]|nr:DUF6776 family protein [Steroidobacteraceae bacterium]